MYPQIDKHFKCIDIYSSKAIVALWVHPYTLFQLSFLFIIIILSAQTVILFHSSLVFGRMKQLTYSPAMYHALWERLDLTSPVYNIVR